MGIDDPKNNPPTDNQSTQSNSGELLFPIGEVKDGETIFKDFSQIPHLLVGGYTGTGKTSLIHSIISYLISNHSSDEMKLIIYDSKSTDYTFFEGLPHLLSSTIIDQKRMTSTLNWVISEIDYRLKLFSNYNIRSIDAFNSIFRNTQNDIMPHIFIIMDDFSGIYKDKEVIDALLRILSVGRITGIHLVLVTSLTTSTVLRRDLLINIPCRVSFCVATRNDSKSVIGQNGAELLSVPGELLFSWNGVLEKYKAFRLKESEIIKIVDTIRRVTQKDINNLGTVAAGIFENSSTFIDNTISDEESKDEFLNAAIEEVIKKQKCSCSYLQRMLRISFNRAARLIDEMYEMGIVGPDEGSKPRKVLYTQEQWTELQKNNSLDQDAKEWDIFLENDAIKTAETEAVANSSDDSDLLFDDTGDTDTESNHEQTDSLSFLDVFDEAFFVQENEEISETSLTSPDETKNDQSSPKEKTTAIRDYSCLYCSNQVSLQIRHNTIIISTDDDPTSSRLSSSTSLQIVPDAIMGLSYKKPRLFTSGYIELHITPLKKDLPTSIPSVTINRTETNFIIKLPYNKSQAPKVKEFMFHLSKEIDIPLSE